VQVNGWFSWPTQVAGLLDEAKVTVRSLWLASRT
jgi:hypothetical protein